MKLVLLLALCVGCADSLAVYSDPRLKAPTEIAMNAWQEALNRGPCPVDLYWSPDADVYVTYAELDSIRRGEYEGERIRVDSDVEADDLAMVIAHELGHALGAGHAKDPAELMYSRQYEQRGPDPTGWDVAAVCEARNQP
jgi:hypothetical protein